MAKIDELTAERDRAYTAWSDMDWRVRVAEQDGTDYRLLPLMKGQVRFLWAEYEAMKALVEARRHMDMARESAKRNLAIVRGGAR